MQFHVHSGSGLFRIREAKATDAETIARVHASSLEAAYRGRVPDALLGALDREERTELWRDALANPEVTTLVGEENGRITAFSTLRASRDADIDPRLVAEMPTLYVDPMCWGRGQGTALCREVLQRARAAGYEVVTLWVMDLNIRARTFYEGLGFRGDGATKQDDGPVPSHLLVRRYRLPLVD